MSQHPILRVAVPAPLRSSFDYLPPGENPSTPLRPGMRLRIPFGKGHRCGLLLEISSERRVEQSSLKAVAQILDDEPLLPSRDLEFLSWVSAYYQHPIGEVLFSALPVRLRNGAAVTTAPPAWHVTAAGKAVELTTLKRAPRQQALLRALREDPGILDRRDIGARFGSGYRELLRNLERKGWIESVVLETDDDIWSVNSSAPGPSLNPAQRDAVNKVEAALGSFGAFLLDGITGSGKTEVYLSLVTEVFKQGRQVLLLAPEIALTPQLMRRFEHRISGHVILLHSSLSDRDREAAWLKARSGRAAVVIGTRSAVFTPMPNLGLVLVDEEHDLSFKQQEGFRYSGRDMAVARARHAGCPVVLGSATPSLESLRNAEENRYQRLRLPERAGNARPPRMDLLDIRSVHLKAGLSPTLIRLVREELDSGNQVLLFLNRRGFAPVLTCHDCGWISECPRCDARLTLHHASDLLWCHHCGHQRRNYSACPTCAGSDLRPLGQGTERVEAQLRSLFPDHIPARIDRDSTRRKGALEKLIGDIRNGHRRLMLGTQMLAKGHHFPDVTLAGILDVDHGLFGADFRSAERMAQLIVQVAGRAGRADKPGRVIIQTRHPDHPLLQILIRDGYGVFADSALEERREAQLPPFSHQALLRAESTDERTPAEFLRQAAKAARPYSPEGVELWGPVPAPMERRAGRYRAHLLLQSADRSRLRRLLADWVTELQNLPAARKVRWSLDIDPQEML